MRKEQEIVDELAAAKASYLSIVDSAPRGKVQTASDKVRALQVELQETLAAGAKPCRNIVVDEESEVDPKTGEQGKRECGLAPVGMLKTPDVLDKDGQLKAGAVYEVGCPVCPIRARGSSPEKAIAQWDRGNIIGAKDPEEPVASVI